MRSSAPAAPCLGILRCFLVPRFSLCINCITHQTHTTACFRNSAHCTDNAGDSSGRDSHRQPRFEGAGQGQDAHELGWETGFGRSQQSGHRQTRPCESSYNTASPPSPWPFELRTGSPRRHSSTSTVCTAADSSGSDCIAVHPSFRFSVPSPCRQRHPSCVTGRSSVYPPASD